MGLIQRINETVTANVNAMVSKAEDPATMAEYQYTKLEREVAELKCRTASVMAEESSIKAELERQNEKRAVLSQCAEKAVAAGNDEDAKILLEKRLKVEKRIASLENTYTAAKNNSAKMKEIYAEMSDKLDTLEETKDSIKSQVAVARAQGALSSIGGKNGGSETISTLRRMEKKANRMARQADALAEIDSTVDGKNAENLEAKYSTDITVDEQLAALKAKVSVN